MKEKTVCFTGHRKIRKKDGDVSAILCEALKSLIRQGYMYFRAGGARGFDALAAETVLELQKAYPQIQLILVLPFADQYTAERDWSDTEIEQYKRLKKSASKVLHLEKAYTRGCYYKRNRHLVDHAGVCICYQYKNTGGTAYTTRYAEAAGIQVINVCKP